MIKSRLFIVSVAAVALCISGCQKEQSLNSSRIVSFVADCSQTTKSCFDSAMQDGAFVSYWTGDETIRVQQNNSAFCNTGITVGENGRALFSADLADDGTGSYTYYAISPASAIEEGFDMTNYRWPLWRFVIPEIQTPDKYGDSVDESAHILFAQSEVYSSTPSSVSLKFGHFASYICIGELMNLPETATVKSVILSFDSLMAGTFEYYPGSGQYNAFYATSEITVNTSRRSKIWAAVSRGSVGCLKVSVNTDQGTFVKLINPSKVLEQGVVNLLNIDMAGTKTDLDPVYYCLSTDTSLGLASNAKTVNLSTVQNSSFAIPLDVQSGWLHLWVPSGHNMDGIYALVGESVYQSKTFLKKAGTTMIDGKSYDLFYSYNESDCQNLLTLKAIEGETSLFLFKK